VVNKVKTLEELRQAIDEVDTKLVHLLNERAKIVQDVGLIKKNDKNAPPIYAPDRERAVLDKIKSQNAGPLPDRCLVAIYRELMSGSFLLERSLRIAYLGPAGSFSHNAAMLKFGQSVEYEPQSDIKGVFDEISRHHCDLGIVPVDNSIAGGVMETLDLLIDSNVSICAEMLMEIHHNLLANCKLADINKLYSRPEVFNQCHQWLNTTLPNVDVIATSSTAQAAKHVANEPYSAAIGSTLAGELYGLKTICENIEDVSSNITRFFIIGRESARPTSDDKTSLVFCTADKSGALVDVLEVFRDKDINLTNIESRPSKKRQKEYYFYSDCQGHQYDVIVQDAVREARKHCLKLEILGSYPRATEVL